MTDHIVGVLIILASLACLLTHYGPRLISRHDTQRTSEPPVTHDHDGVEEYRVRVGRES